MEYPDDFDTFAFPAGRRIAVSRQISIWILTVFLLIVCVCGMIAWAVHSVRVTPYIITVDSITGQWGVIGRSVTRTPKYADTRAMQESVAVNFTQSVFSISNTPAENDAIWRACTRTECSGAEILPYGGRECAISCLADAGLYNSLIETSSTNTGMMQTHYQRAAAGETWGIIPETVSIVPVGDIRENGAVWRIQAKVWSNINADFDIVAFVRISHTTGQYPMTLGYYVSDFNAYRINK